jgi:hypothetical protein
MCASASPRYAQELADIDSDSLRSLYSHFRRLAIIGARACLYLSLQLSSSLVKMISGVHAQALFKRYEQLKIIELSKNDLIEVWFSFGPLPLLPRSVATWTNVRLHELGFIATSERARRRLSPD